MSLIDTLQKAVSTLSDTVLNRYSLDIPSCTAPLDVEDFIGTESLSDLYRYTLIFTSTHKDIEAGQVLRKPATLTMGTGPLQNLSGQKVVHGLVTSFKRLRASADQSVYQIILEPFFSLLDRQFRTHRFFVNKSVPEVVEQILTEHGLKGWEYEFQLKVSYPQRGQINQYRESDLAFIERLLAEVGIFYFFTLQPDTQTEVIHFADRQSAWEFGKTLPLNSPSGMSDSGADSVWGLNVLHNVVEASVTTKDYNHREAQKRLDSAPADMTRGDGEGITYGDVYHYRARHEDSGSKSEPEAESGNFYARLDHERFLSRQILINGASTDATLRPGQVLTISDNSHPSSLPELLQKPLVTQRVNFSASRKDPLRVAFTAVPYSETRCWRPALKVRPEVTGTLTARVTSAKENDIYAWQDASGLYRVKFDADRDDRSKGQESMPVRLAKPYGGDTYGLHFPLVQGTEVAIAFHEGDPDRPYIAHALHDSRHPDPVTEKNSTRNVMRTPANNKLRMEDKRGEEHVKLSTDYGGKSQLNLGHNVDAERTLRGEGFELRSDKWGAIRGGKGLFISADKQATANGKMLEMQDTIDRLEQAGEQMTALSDDAQTAEADPAQVDVQLAFMREQIDQLKEAVAVLSAPNGVVLSSGKHLQLAASQNLMFSAGENADVGVVKRLFIGAGEGLSLFIRKLGMKLIANQGAVTIQAQNDQLQLLACKGLEIVSTEDEIHIVAKKKIIINAGGSYLTLDPYKIELGTKGDFIVKSADFQYLGPASMTADHPDYPLIQAPAQQKAAEADSDDLSDSEDAKYSEEENGEDDQSDALPSKEPERQSLLVNVSQTPNASDTTWAGMPYNLYADGALIDKGVLDKSAELRIDHQVVTKNYLLVLANGVNYEIPVVSSYHNPEQGEFANRGLHNYSAQGATDVNAPASHTVHRNLYAELLDGLNDKGES